jgi:hypothetical protein
MCFVIASLIIAMSMAAASPYKPLPAEPSAGAAKQQGSGTERRERVDDGRAGLPYAFGQRFDTLEDYLAHLRKRAAPIDLPWWRPVGPDHFEHVTARRMPAGQPEIVTREELMRRFGFTR